MYNMFYGIGYIKDAFTSEISDDNLKIITNFHKFFPKGF